MCVVGITAILLGVIDELCWDQPLPKVKAQTIERRLHVRYVRTGVRLFTGRVIQKPLLKWYIDYRAGCSVLFGKDCLRFCCKDVTDPGEGRGTAGQLCSVFLSFALSPQFGGIAEVVISKNCSATLNIICCWRKLWLFHLAVPAVLGLYRGFARRNVKMPPFPGVGGRDFS